MKGMWLCWTCYVILLPVFGQAAQLPHKTRTDIHNILRQENPNIVSNHELEKHAAKRADCKYLGERRDITSKRLSEEGDDVSGFVDGLSQEGNSVYELTIPEILLDLDSEPEFKHLVVEADEYGCHINTGCEDPRQIIACFFKKRQVDEEQDEQPVPDDVVEDDLPSSQGKQRADSETEARTSAAAAAAVAPSRVDEADSSTSTRVYVAQSSPHDRPQQQQPGRGSVRARAFTQNQKRQAESIVRVAWDRTYLLENMAGMEADCAMADQVDWSFAFSERIAEKRGFEVHGVIGTAINAGDVDDAVTEIFTNIKSIVQKFKVYQMGCAVIPGCISPGLGPDDAEVVIACLFRN